MFLHTHRVMRHMVNKADHVDDVHMLLPRPKSAWLGLSKIGGELFPRKGHNHPHFTLSTTMGNSHRVLLTSAY